MLHNARRAADLEDRSAALRHFRGWDRGGWVCG